MDYSQLSDFEINKLVAYALGNADVGRPFDEISGNACRFTVFKNSGLNREGEIVMRPMTVTKDFCNNPADAWQIIVDNRIAVIPDTAAGEWVAFNEFTLYEGDWMFASDPTHHSIGKNPLRCAMETFLMMQDANNV